VYGHGAMSHSSSIDSTRSAIGPDTISRRAYELWEKEGRPEGSDLRHWLQAEQELGINRADNGLRPEERDSMSAGSSSGAPRTDAQPLQGTRAGAAAGRESKRGSASPFTDKNSTNGRRKTAGAPAT
jgi:hypothetical protein